MAGGSGWVVSRAMWVSHGKLCLSSTWQLKPRSVITPGADAVDIMYKGTVVEVAEVDWLSVISEASSRGIEREFGVCG